jgi:hypothetical protein
MPALPPNIPAKQADFNSCANNFSTLITDDPAQYGLTAADGSSIAAAVSNCQRGLRRGRLVRAPRPRSSVQAKNAARATAMAVLRPNV